MTLASTTSAKGVATVLDRGSGFANVQPLSSVRTTALRTLPMVAFATRRQACDVRRILSRVRRRLGTSILVCLGLVHCISSSAADVTAEARESFANLSTWRDEQAVKLKDIGERFAHLDLRSVVDVAHFISDEGITRNRKTVTQMRGLVSERRTLVAEYIDAYQSQLGRLPDGDFKRGAAFGFNENQAKTVQMFRDLDAALLAFADAADALLDWCQPNVGHIFMDGNRFRFESPQQQSQMQELFLKLAAANEGLAAVQEKAAAQQAATRARMRAAEVEATKALSE